MSLFIDNGRIDTEEGERRAAGLCRNCTRKRSNQNRSSLRLPPCINYGTTAAADVLMIPHPCLRIDRFANRAKQAER